MDYLRYLVEQIHGIACCLGENRVVLCPVMVALFLRQGGLISP